MVSFDSSCWGSNDYRLSSSSVVDLGNMSLASFLAVYVCYLPLFFCIESQFLLPVNICRGLAESKLSLEMHLFIHTINYCGLPK
jgi:hypothetical protein